MKKLIAVATVAVFMLTIITSCKKLISKIFNGFDADVPTIQFTLPPIPFAPPQEIPLGTFTQRFNLDSTIKANTDSTFGADDVSSIKIKKIIFSLSNADQNNNLANFESARFTFSSNTQTNPLEIASATFPDTYASSYTYTSPASAPELKPFLTGTELYYHAYGKARRPTSKSLKLVIQVTLTLK